MTTVHNGLEGIVAAETRLSMVDGNAGELIIAGYRVEDLAPRATFEEVAELFGLRWQSHRFLSAATLELLKAAALPPQSKSVMDALRMAAGTLDEDDLPTVLPAIVASYWRLLHGLEPVEPREDLGYAANYLYMLRGGITILAYSRRSREAGSVSRAFLTLERPAGNPPRRRAVR